MSKIEDEVCRKIQERAALGLRKYGVTLMREDLTTLDWLIHFQEELMDAVDYCEVLIQRERAKMIKETNPEDYIKALNYDTR